MLGVPATILLLIQAVTQDDALLPYSSALEAVLYFYAAYALIRYMLEDHVITRDELFAVGATFTLVAWAFAYSFTVYQAIEPDSFTAAVNAAEDRTWIELLFLSFTTLSSTASATWCPITPFAREPRDARAARRGRLHRDGGVAARRPPGAEPARARRR